MPPFHRLARVAVLPAVLLTGLACSVFSPGATPLPPTPEIPVTRTADFTVRYDWREGSLPPPYHYEYTIEVAPDGLVTLTYTPDYPGPEVPVWVESVNLDPAQMDALYATLREADLYTTAWRTEDGPPVGGSSEWLTATAAGVTVEVPPYPVDGQRDTATRLALVMQGLIPQATWDYLNAQRDNYVAEHEE